MFRSNNCPFKIMKQMDNFYFLFFFEKKKYKEMVCAPNKMLVEENHGIQRYEQLKTPADSSLSSVEPQVHSTIYYFLIAKCQQQMVTTTVTYSPAKVKKWRTKRRQMRTRCGRPTRVCHHYRQSQNGQRRHCTRPTHHLAWP
jgi:hypothetical protein